jgi:2-polyprenyl-6-methoxyphenol hydroxylase-like FAD-dependent oxidoreductase
LDHDISARYLIGCDGAHSEIRRKIGARLSGFAVIDVQSTYIRAPTLLGMMPALVWAIDCINPRSRGLVFAIDGRKRWLVHSFLKPGESRSAVDRPRGIREILGVESEFVFDILGREDWTGRRMSPTASVTSV